MSKKEYAKTLTEKCIMECVGTAMLCFTVATAAGQGAPMTALSVGATLMCIVYFGAHVSGGQYNPAVALSIFLRGKMSPLELGAYALSQIAGGFIGGLLGMACIGTEIGYPAVPSTGNYGSAIVGEIVTTFALCHTILHVATTAAQVNNSYYGLAIGFTVLAGAIGVGPFSGGAFNPAVGIALPLLRGEATDFWVYILGPLAGASLASLLFAFTHANELPGTGPLRSLKTKFAESPVRKLGAPIAIEFVGTGLLAFTVSTAASPHNGTVLAPLAIGSTLMCQVYAGGATSGGQYNPAVTIGIALRKSLASWSVDKAGSQLKEELTNTKTIAYIIAQCAGALIFGLLGAVVVYQSTDTTTVYSTMNGTLIQVNATQHLTGIGYPAPGYVGHSFVAEVVGTFFLVFVVLQSATSAQTADNDFFGLAIGFTVTAMAVAVGAVSGGAFNPAIGLLGCVAPVQSTMTAVGGTYDYGTVVPDGQFMYSALGSSITHIWIYWLACPLGGVLAALLFRVTNAPEFVDAKADPKTAVAVKKRNTVFADDTEGPRVSNVLFAKIESKSALGESRTASTTTPPKEYPIAEGVEEKA